MTAAEFKSIRKRLGLSRMEMARALGYQGKPNSMYVQIAAYEGGKRDIPPWIARLAAMYARHGVPDEFAA